MHSSKIRYQHGETLVHEVLEFVCRRYDIPKVLVSDREKDENLGQWGCSEA
jgi:hypothetical protein